jgi:hypothetical protein
MALQDRRMDRMDPQGAVKTVNLKYDLDVPASVVVVALANRL